MTEKNRIYSTILALVEEELHHRLTPGAYVDNRYDGTNFSICGSSNLDIDIKEPEPDTVMKGGSSLNMNYIPGKFDVVRYSHNVPLAAALKGSRDRQRLFMQENQKN